MKRGWWYKFLVLCFVAFFSSFVLIPTVFDFKETDQFPVKSKINLGLDLQGGLYMIMGIDFNQVFKDEVKSYARRIQYVLKDSESTNVEVGSSNITDPADPKHSIVARNASELEGIKDNIKKYFPNAVRFTAEEGTSLEFGLTKTTKETIESQALSKSIEVIRNRIDEFGVTEPEITSQGNDRIIIQLPGVKDIQKAKDLIGKTARLEFRMVNDEISFAQITEWIKKTKDAGIEFKKGDRYSDYIRAVNVFLEKDLPKDHQIVFEKTTSKVTNETTNMLPYLVEANTKLTGDDLEDARVDIDQERNQPIVALRFKSTGAKTFEELTGASIGRRMAIVLDGNVYSAPNINERIPGGRATITLGSGGYNKALTEAKDLALVLRAGALPVRLDFLEQRTVGPSLGQDSIEKARYAAAIGAILVIVFILFYYRVSGFVALVTLTLNIIIILACLVGLEATLTLPGIAGIALTIGMAIDANIIIYERIREEVRLGVSNYKAVGNGFEHAFWTILDANITTALAGLCLLNFGTGPIKGFAVTLLIGIFATVYTSYFVGKLMFELYMNKVEGQELSI